MMCPSVRRQHSFVNLLFLRLEISRERVYPIAMRNREEDAHYSKPLTCPMSH